MSKVHFNIKNVHYAVATEGTGGALTYETPVAMPGAVSLNTDPTGDEGIFYADGIEYYKSWNNTGYEGELELALIPDSFLIDVLGQIKDTKNVLVEDANAPAVKFALGFQVDGDVESTYFWFYNCSASRPSTEANTNEESKEPDTQTLEWSCAPNADGYVRAKTTESTAASDISSWFTAVYAPTMPNG